MIKLCLFLFILYFARTVSSQLIEGSNHKRPTYIELLIEDLRDVHWDEDETLCWQRTVDILENVKNLTLWATWIWDSNQSPVGLLTGSQHQLGNFDQCLNAPWVTSNRELRTQYCLADVRLGDVTGTRRGGGEPHDSAQIYITTSTKYAVEFNAMTWGACVPDACAPSAVAKLLGVLLRHTHLSSLGGGADIRVDSCQVAGHPQTYSFGFYACIFVASALLIVALTSTWYVNRPKEDENSNAVNEIHDGLVTDVAKSFCMRTNTSDLVKVQKNDIKVLHGIRFLSAVILINMHVFCMISIVGAGNRIKAEETMDTFMGLLFRDSGLIVDTFFMMSALLLVKGQISRTITSPFKTILKRYIRLIGPVVVVVMLMSHVFAHCGDGPLWRRFAAREQRACQNNGWLNLLLVANYVLPKELCYPTMWSVACDFQMSVVGVLLLYQWQRDRRSGIAVFCTLAALSVLLPGYITWVNRYPAVPIFDIGTIQKIFDVMPNALADMYSATHTRMGPYFVGMAMGYLMTVYDPSEYRRSISKKLSIIGATMSLLTMLSLLVVGGSYYARAHGRLEAAAFAALNRSVWAAAVCVLVACCEYGQVDLMSGFLGSSVFLPLSRISYGLYILHPMILQRNVFATRYPLTLNVYSMTLDANAALVLGCAASLLTWLLVEAPLTKITNVLLNGKPKPKQQQKLDLEEKVKMNGASKKHC